MKIGHRFGRDLGFKRLVVSCRNGAFHPRKNTREFLSCTQLGPYGICDETEQWVPDDIENLWDRFNTLPEKFRKQFMSSGDIFLA
jgi:hypothetical protein